MVVGMAEGHHGGKGPPGRTSSKQREKRGAMKESYSSGHYLNDPLSLPDHTSQQQISYDTPEIQSSFTNSHSDQMRHWGEIQI